MSGEEVGVCSPGQAQLQTVMMQHVQWGLLTCCIVIIMSSTWLVCVCLVTWHCHGLLAAVVVGDGSTFHSSTDSAWNP